jgi:hypothetical protein
MSRAFDTRQQAITVYPEDREAGVGLFLGYLDCSESDFKYEFNQSPEEYIYGEKEDKQ